MAMELHHDLPLPQPRLRLRVNKLGRPFIVGHTDVVLRENLRATLMLLLALPENAVCVHQVALECRASIVHQGRSFAVVRTEITGDGGVRVMEAMSAHATAEPPGR